MQTAHNYRLNITAVNLLEGDKGTLGRVAVIRIGYVSNKVRLDIAAACFATKVDTILKISCSARRASFGSKLEGTLASTGVVSSYVVLVVTTELYLRKLAELTEITIGRHVKILLLVR